MAYHLQTDGQTECVNQELKLYLKMYIDYRQLDWLEWLALAEFTYNNWEYSLTKMTPFFINTDLNPLNPRRIIILSLNLSTEIFATTLKKIYSQAQKNLEEVNKRIKEAHNK